jgi:predicted MFS family arabinose efflux permease
MGSTDARLPRSLVALLAFATGAAVANLWYIQPLLNEVARVFHTSDGMAGLLVAFAQAGYVLGLALVVPLGDLHERRGLITTVLLGTAAAAAACALAPSIGVLAAALLALGMTACVAQILVPLASSLAGPEERGQVVGTVMSGLLIGILLARTVSGLIAEIGGWRLVFALAAVGMVALSLVLRRALPEVPPTESMPYRTLLRSVWRLVVEEPVLRQRMAIGALTMASFSGLWTSITFLLGASPYGYSEGIIGLFGLAGVAGALIAPLAGRWGDQGHGRRAVTLFLLAVLVGWGLLALGRTSLLFVVLGLVVIDLGVQGTQISNQSTIYRLRPEARSRLTSAYIVAYFIGGTVGSMAATLAYGAAGWVAVCVFGGAATLGAFAVWAASQRAGRAMAAPAR